MSTEGQAVKRLTPDEITDQIHRLAREGEGSDQRWALKMLSAETQGSALPEPLNAGEIEDRVARILRCCGQEMSRRAFYTAFRKGDALTYKPVTTTSEAIAKWSHIIFPTTMRKFNRMFPEMKRPGMPAGYPKGRSDVEKREFLMKLSIKCLEDRERRENELVSREEAGHVPTANMSTDAIENEGNEAGQPV